LNLNKKTFLSVHVCLKIYVCVCWHSLEGDVELSCGKCKGKGTGTGECKGD